MTANARPSSPSLPVPVVCILLVGWMLLGLPGRAAPTFVVDKKGLIAQGITPGGRVIWWSVAHERPDSFVTIVHRLEEQTDTDLDGAVLFAHEGDLPEASIWVAVDVATGAYGAYTPAELGVSETPLPPETAVQLGDPGRGISDAVREVARPMIEVLLIRPGQGGWDLRAGDGGDTDQDGGIEGEITFPIDGMAPVGASPLPPTRYLTGDLLLSIDIDQLELSSLVVAASPPPPPPPGGSGFRAGVRR